MPAAPRRLAVATLALLFAVASCSDGPPTAPAADAAPTVLEAEAVANANIRTSDAPGAPEPISQTRIFKDFDPCTDDVHVVTIASTIWVHRLPNGNQVARWERTITTSSGYEGHGVRTQVDNGNVFKLTNNDVVSHPDGRKFLAQGVLVVDLTTDPPTTRVQMGGFNCIRS